MIGPKGPTMMLVQATNIFFQIGEIFSSFMKSNILGKVTYVRNINNTWNIKEESLIFLLKVGR